MPIESAEELMKKIFLRYNKKPSGWNFLVGKGHEDRFFDILISQGSEVWQIKVDTIYKPNPLGIGAKVEVEKSKKIFDNPYSFGFRPLSEKQIMRLVETGLSKKAVENIMKSRPRPINKIKTPVVVQGPIMYSGLPPSLKPFDFISKKQQKLDSQLSKELDKLIKKSGTTIPYG
jgi:hypothetical protein